MNNMAKPDVPGQISANSLLDAHWYPLSSTGPLCPLLDDADLLYSFYSESNSKKGIKAFFKKTSWTDKPKVPNVIDTPILKQLIRSMCNSGVARKKLADSKSSLDLHTVMMKWIRNNYPEIFEKLMNCFSVTPEKLTEKLNSFTEEFDSEIDSKGNVIIYAFLGLSMMHSSTAKEILGLLVDRWPFLIDKFDPNIHNVTSEGNIPSNQKNECNVALDSFLSEESAEYEMSLEELAEFREGLSKSIIELREIRARQESLLENLNKAENVGDYIDDSAVQITLNRLEDERKIFAQKYHHLTNFISNKQGNSLSCLTSPLISILYFFSELEKYIKKIEYDLSKAAQSKILIESLISEETNLLTKGQLTDPTFPKLKEFASASEICSHAERFTSHLELVRDQVTTTINQSISEILAVCEEIQQTCAIDEQADLDIIRRAKAVCNQNSSIKVINKAKFQLQSLFEKYRDLKNLQWLAENALGKPEALSSSVLDICRVLNLQKKSKISFLLLTAFERSYQPEDLIECNAGNFEVLVETYCQSIQAGIPSDLVFEQITLSPWFLSLSSDTSKSNEFQDRLMIFFVIIALNGHVEFSSLILTKINAYEHSKISIPEKFKETIVAIISYFPIKMISTETTLKLDETLAAIKNIIAFESGKYRNTQRNARHFSRFETVRVFPALESLWKDTLHLIDQRKFSSAVEKIGSVDVTGWHQELLNSYDKSLFTHVHFSNVTKRAMENFVASVRDYVNEFSNFEDGTLVLSTNDLNASISTWASGDRARAEFVLEIKSLFDDIKESSDESPNIVDLLATDLTVAENCPAFFAWWVKQKSHFSSEDILSLILKDLSIQYDADTINEKLEDVQAWNLLAAIWQHRDEKLSKYYLSKNELDFKFLREKQDDVYSLSDSELSNDFMNSMKLGKVLVAKQIVAEAENRQNILIQAQKKQLLEKIHGLLNDINIIKDDASLMNAPDSWQETVGNYAAKIERRLRRLRSAEGSQKDTESEFDKIFRAVGALRSNTQSGSKAFEEIEFHLSTEENKSELCEATEVALATQRCPDLIKFWNLLASSELIDSTEVKRIWGQFIREFAIATRLYYDEHSDKKRFFLIPPAASKYNLPIYQTNFYKPQSEFLKRPLRLYLYRHDIDIKGLQTLEEELHSEDAAARLHIVFAPQGKEKIQKFFRYESVFKNFVLFDEKFIYQMAACDKPGIPVRQALHASVTDLANSSPFVAQGYCHQANNIYVGRREVLQRLLNNPQAMIWGGRRIGKTSVLHALEQALNNRNYMVAFVYVDIQDVGDPDLAIAKKIGQTLGFDDVKNLQDFVRKVSRLIAGGAKIAFLIDEVDEYIKKSRQFHNAFPLATALRQLVMEDKEKNTFLVYSGYHQLYFETKLHSEKLRVGHPFINVAQEVPIRDLTQDDVLELVKTGFEDMLGISVSPEVPRLISHRASRHPAFVQQFCRCLLEHVSHRRSPGKKVTVTADDVEAVYGANTSREGGEQAFILYVNETLGYNLSHLGRAIMLAITECITEQSADNSEFFSGQQIYSHLKEWCELIPIEAPVEEHFAQTIELLMMTNMLTQNKENHDSYCITYPTYLDILKRLNKMGRNAIENSLQQYDKSERQKGVLL